MRQIWNPVRKIGKKSKNVEKGKRREIFDRDIKITTHIMRKKGEKLIKKYLVRVINNLIACEP